MSSRGARLQSNLASAGGSSRSPTGSSLIFTPTSTQLDFQDADGVGDQELEADSTSPESNNNNNILDDYVHIHSNNDPSDRSSHSVRSSGPNIGPFYSSESPHSYTATMIPSQRWQASFTSTSSVGMDESTRQLSSTEMHPNHRTSNELLSNVGNFDTPFTDALYQDQGLPLRTPPNNDVSSTSFGNMAMLSRQMAHLSGPPNNNGFAQYHGVSSAFVAPVPQQPSPSIPSHDSVYSQYIQSMSRNSAMFANTPQLPAAVQSHDFSSYQPVLHTADALYQQQPLHAIANFKSSIPSIRASNANRLDAAQASYQPPRRSAAQAESSRSTTLHARENADRVRKGGRSRNSHLSDKTREKSSVMRKVGACWRCAMQRDPCDHGDPCSRCTMRSQRGQTYFFDCDRSKLPDFVHEFLPPSMTIMHQKQTIEDSVASSVLTWDHDNGIDIYLSSGYGPPLRWKVYEFRPKSEEYLRQLQYYQDNGSDQMVRTVNYSPPYGLLKIEPSDDAHLDTYLDQLLQPQFLWDFGWTFYEAESLVDEFQAGVLDLLCKLYLTTEDDLLKQLLYDILRMLLITYIMGHTLTISDDTVPTVIANVRHSRKPSNYNQKYTSPRLANRQLKFFFAVLRNGIYEKLLKWQQQTLHTAGKKDQTWLPAFCVTLGFAMVLEEVQHTLFIQADASVARNDMTREDADRQASNACERIDARFKLLIGLFQCKYRDKRWGDDGSFGPGTPEVKDLSSKVFLEELREIVVEKCDHLKSRENVAFSQENQCYFTSRLTAKFLVPFLNLPG
ncbi:uncharacterized protein RCC_03780 [Ramularia collo-cygni]|uniref:Zn(2)-C6 fungal-type domain-containing protein n=1 Tax=Ramularia collo-cygni TaxID=112498 RepID=A0A2D3UNW7_9PEZI|nr:uncharacterized protein RCC_03780 [Ramularia collo-cygni]CZT17942.1 uncharacterized protein RCC_03780 [Ramularia collo-cygni]